MKLTRSRRITRNEGKNCGSSLSTGLLNTGGNHWLRLKQLNGSPGFQMPPTRSTGQVASSSCHHIPMTVLSMTQANMERRDVSESDEVRLTIVHGKEENVRHAVGFITLQVFGCVPSV